MAIFGVIFASYISSSCMQHISDLHFKFARRPHTMCRSMVDMQSATAEIRRGKRRRRKKEER